MLPAPQAVRSRRPEVRQQHSLEAIASRAATPPRVAVELRSGEGRADEGRAERAEHADAVHACLFEHGFDELGGGRGAPLEGRVHEILERLAAAHADEGGDLIPGGRPVCAERRQLLELAGEAAEIGSHAGEEQLPGLGREREAQLLRPVGHPALDPRRGQRRNLDGRCPAHELGVGWLGGAVHQHQHRGGIGRIDIAEQLLTHLSRLAKLLHAPKNDGPGGGKHGGCVHQRIECLGVEIGDCALVNVEVAGSRVDRVLEEGAHRLVLEHVLLAMEIVDGIRRALLQAPKQRVKGERPHTGRKLP